LIEVVGERTGGRESGHTRTDHDGLLADQS
jgi:hypothetical protein